MPDPYTRPLWQTKLQAYVLAAALLGLVGCALRMGWLCWTA